MLSYLVVRVDFPYLRPVSQVGLCLVCLHTQTYDFINFV